MKGFLDRPQGIVIVARFDQSDAAGIEAELAQTMAMEPARGEEGWRRADDEKGAIAWGDRRHERREEAERRRLIFRRGGMDFLHAFKRQSFPGEMPVEREAKGKGAARL